VAVEEGDRHRLELVLRAAAALVEHDLPRAFPDLATAADDLQHGASVTPPLPYIGAYVLVGAALDEPVPADVRTVVATQVPANRAAFAWADAVALGRAGRAAEAVARYADGAAALAHLPWWRRLLHTVVLERAVVDGWGDPVPALRADLAAHEQACVPALARTCRDLLRRAGAPTPRRRAGTAVAPRLLALGITAREAEVLELVAQGLTNAQVAERLFVSPRTVDTHVANLLTKTGTSARTQLRAWVREHP
jgi:DNA-binding CsgD family transcriptional regulator